MGDTKAIITAKIQGKKVMVFSKSYCPYCSMAKKALNKYIGKELSKDEIEIWEIENDPKCQVLQAELRKMTGASSVSIHVLTTMFVFRSRQTNSRKHFLVGERRRWREYGN